MVYPRMAPIEKYVLIGQVKTEAVTALKQIMLDNGLVSGHWCVAGTRERTDK